MDLRNCLVEIIERARAERRSSDVAVIERALKFFVGSMHEFFGESREALRIVIRRAQTSDLELAKLQRLVERITEALGMDNET
jgi:hypothetical protein